MSHVKVSLICKSLYFITSFINFCIHICGCVFAKITKLLYVVYKKLKQNFYLIPYTPYLEGLLKISSISLLFWNSFFGVFASNSRLQLHNGLIHCLKTAAPDFDRGARILR